LRRRAGHKVDLAALAEVEAEEADLSDTLP
jgi:hypothetical protein